MGQNVFYTDNPTQNISEPFLIIYNPFYLRISITLIFNLANIRGFKANDTINGYESLSTTNM